MFDHVCDGEEDCFDGSDEERCASQCSQAEFRCAHGRKCVAAARVCDGRDDCQDLSDERDCERKTSGLCHHRCDGGIRCLPHTFLCDGEDDCSDGSDEKNCGVRVCPAELPYRCASGQCLSEGLRCDGHPDCSDHSDEWGCSRPPHCPTQLRCPSSHECLEKEWLCDGEDDCKDGWDEKNCTSPAVVACMEHQWQCGGDSECIPVSWKCDGQADCHNSMDEDQCGRRNCPAHMYQCGSGDCVPPDVVCDRVRNCVDGSDEGNGCLRRNCTHLLAPRCERLCVSTPGGPRCFCPAGFRLHPNTGACSDTNECVGTRHECKHICVNAPGSYSCRCHAGFYLEPDGTSCKTKDEPLLLASVQSELLLLGIHSGSLRLLLTARRPVFSLDYNWEQQRIYWLSPDYQSIHWTDTRSPDSKRTLIKGVKADFIAVDWVGDNLYWVDGLVGQILAVRLSNRTLRSQDFTVVLGEDLEQPSSLVLVPHRGLMLWSEIGSSPHIERSGMDGSRRKVVVNHSLSWPAGLAYDFVDGRMFWADEKLRCIGSATLDGDDIKILQLAETPGPFSVAVFNDRVFWSDTKRRTIRSADKNTGKDQKVLLKRPGQPFGLKLMHALSQQSPPSPCKRLHCSHLCLLGPAINTRSRGAARWELSAVCRCPRGLMLSRDGASCSPPVDSSFILLLSHSAIHQLYLQSVAREGVALKKMPSHRPLQLPGLTEASLLDASVHNLAVYVADAARGTVDVLKVGDDRSRQGLAPVGQVLKLTGERVTALALDWVTSNLYWSSSLRPHLHVTSRQGGHTALLLQGALQGATSLAVHPPSGRLCFAVAGGGGRSLAQVACAWMDGRRKAALWTRATLPVSLAFSDDGATVYWADSGQGVISCVGVNGSGYQEIQTGPGLLASFTHTDNMLLWVTLHNDVSKLWFSDGLQPNQLWFETRTNLVGAKAFSVHSQTGSNSCSDGGGCAQLCLAFPGGRTCACGRGFVPATGNRSCSPVPSGQEDCSQQGGDCQSGPGGAPPEDSDSASSRNIKVQPPAPPPTSSLAPRPAAEGDKEEKSVLSGSCEQRRCHGRGRCAGAGCRCRAGFTGEFCQEAVGGRSHGAALLGSLVLAILLAAAAFILLKRRSFRAFGSSKSPDKQTLMANMSLQAGRDESDSEELDSPVDVKNPTSLQLQHAN